MAQSLCNGSICENGSPTAVHAPLDTSTSQSIFSSAQNVESRNSASSCLGSSCPGNMHCPSSDKHKLGPVADLMSVAVPTGATSWAPDYICQSGKTFAELWKHLLSSLLRVSDSDTLYILRRFHKHFDADGTFSCWYCFKESMLSSQECRKAVSWFTSNAFRKAGVMKTTAKTVPAV